MFLHDFPSRKFLRKQFITITNPINPNNIHRMDFYKWTACSNGINYYEI